MVREGVLPSHKQREMIQSVLILRHGHEQMISSCPERIPPGLKLPNSGQVRTNS